MGDVNASGRRGSMDPYHPADELSGGMQSVSIHGPGPRDTPPGSAPLGPGLSDAIDAVFAVRWDCKCS